MIGLMSTSCSFFVTFSLSARTGAKDFTLCVGKMLPKILKSRGLLPRPAAMEVLADDGSGKTS